MAQAPTASARILALVFTDIVDSTALKSEKGDEAASALIARHREAVQRISGETQGRIIDWAGDGCFQTFDTPSAAVRFALALRSVHTADAELPHVRTGIHMGEVTEAEGTDGSTRVEGLAVDIAARIESLALPGQILLSTGVFNSARQRLNSSEFETPIAWCAHGAYLFKGFDDPMEVGEVGFEGTSPLEAPKASEKAQRATAPTEEDTLGWRPAAGQTIPGHAHWVLDEQLGLGGYGEVWLASNVNTRDKHVFKFCFQPDRLRGLKREVVLFRLLKESLGDRDDIARVLDWDLEHQPYFIETEYTEGGDLKIWAELKGGIVEVPLETRLELVAQVASALAAAHGAGVLHKDIKPANILISELSGAPKACLTDFGIGLLTDPNALKAKGITATGLTKTLVAGKSSSTSGTAMYIAPELHEGKPPSEKSDIFGLGVMLYQVAIGDLNHAMAAGWERDVADPLLREDIAACVDGNPDHRIESADELADRLRNLESRRAEQSAAEEEAVRAATKQSRREGSRRRLVGAVTAIVVVAVIGVLATQLMRSSSEESRVTWARQEALPEIRSLIESGDYLDAFELSEEVGEIIPDDPTLLEYVGQATNTVNVSTTPPGATISYQPYDRPEAEWTVVGVSPLQDLRAPLGYYRWRAEIEGRQSRTTVAFVERSDILLGVGQATGSGSNALILELPAAADTPAGMLHVDGGTFLVGLTGFLPQPSMIPRFFVDRTEVTNAAFKEFVDAGGYDTLEYWNHEFIRDGETLSFDTAISAFVDATGRPGPATWELGSYPDGQADFPVGGVSWFEAAAYAEFRDKRLPSLYHWSRAAHPFAEILRPLGPLIGEQSNYSGAGPVAVATHTGIGGSGAYDVAGNVREWCWNDAEDGKRYALGGAWNDAPYMYTMPLAQPAWDRSPVNGFRCVVYPNDVRGPANFFDPRPRLGHVDAPIVMIQDEAFSIVARRFEYSDSPLQVVVEEERAVEEAWAEEHITLAAAYDNERFDVRLHFPLDQEPPYKAVIFVPGINSLSASTYTPAPWEEYEFIPKSGRVLVKPTLADMYERGRGRGTARLLDPHQNSDVIAEWIKDLSRTIDYLESREDVITDDLTYIGFSMGAMMAPIILAHEPRFEVAVLASGGLTFSELLGDSSTSLTSYIPRVTIPLLMMNGRHDYLFPADTSQSIFFDALGTPEDHKKRIVYDAGHAPLPRTEVLRDTLAWLDTYQK